MPSSGALEMHVVVFVLQQQKMEIFPLLPVEYLSKSNTAIFVLQKQQHAFPAVHCDVIFARK